MKKYVGKHFKQPVKSSRSIKASSDMSVDEMWDCMGSDTLRDTIIYMSAYYEIDV